MKFFETSKFHTLKKSTYISLRWIGIIGQLISVYIVYFFESDDKLDANIPAGHLLVLFSSSTAIVVGTYNLLGIEPLTRAAAESLLY